MPSYFYGGKHQDSPNGRISKEGAAMDYAVMMSGMTDTNGANISFIQKDNEPAKVITFGDVKINQFFVGISGALYQKSTNDMGCRIARYDGTPNSNEMNFDSSSHIDRILPHIDKIEF